MKKGRLCERHGAICAKLVRGATTVAASAGIMTLLTGTSVRLDAGPLAGPARGTLKARIERPWPYLNCVGTPFGDPRIRLVTTDHLSK